MPPKTRSIKDLLKQPASTTDARAKREAESARRFAQFQTLHKYVQQNWDGSTIIVPLPPNLTNDVARLHWARQRELKEQYATFLLTLECTRLMPKPPAEPPEMTHMSVKFYVPQLMDVIDNLGARLKWPVDFLKMRGWMIDDSPKHVTWAGLPEQELCGKTPPRIEIKLKGN